MAVGKKCDLHRFTCGQENLESKLSMSSDFLNFIFFLIFEEVVIVENLESTEQ